MNESAPLALSYFERMKQVRFDRAAERLGVFGVALAIAGFSGAAIAEAGQEKNMSEEVSTNPYHRAGDVMPPLVLIDEAFWATDVSCRTDYVVNKGFIYPLAEQFG